MIEGAGIMVPELGPVPVFEPRVLSASDWHDGILIRTPNWLGDAVMAIPAILEFRKILPECCGVFVLCPEGIAPVFRALPVVDRVIPLKNPHAFMTARERSLVYKLQPGATVLFNNSLRDVLSLRLAGISKLYGSAARGRSVFMERSYSFPPRRDHVLNLPHQAAKYLSIAASFGAGAWDGVFPEFRFSAPGADEKFSAFAGNKAILTMAAGAAYGSAKRWPDENFSTMATHWVSHGGTVLMLGSRKESDAAEEILDGLPQGKVFNLCGKTSMDELMYVLRQSTFCLANDSGVMHLAAALGLPGIALFGPTDPSATSPLSKKWRIIYSKIDCSPCFKRVCPLGTRECFDEVLPDFVEEVMNNMLLEFKC